MPRRAPQFQMVSRIRLQPVRLPEHRGLVLSLLDDPRLSGRYRGLTNSSPPDAFDRVLRDQVLAQSMLVDENGGLVGLVQCFAASLKHGTAQIGVTLRPEYHRAAWPLFGVVLFMDNLWLEYPLRKLYVEVAAHNRDAMARGLESLFSWEGRLSQHEYWNGGYEDVHFYSMSRERFFSEEALIRAIRHRAGVTDGRA